MWRLSRRALLISSSNSVSRTKSMSALAGAHARSLARAREVEEYWYGACMRDGWSAASVDRTEATLWYGYALDKAAQAALDKDIKARFADDIARLRAGELDAWADSAPGVTALCVLGDQMTRNCFRSSGEAFSCDPKMQRIVLAATRKGMDEGLPLVVRCNWRLVLEHAEDLALHQESRAFLAAQRAVATDEHTRTSLDNMLKYLDEHTAVIARFGRYPHRNRALGRASTPEEAEYLAANGGGWGQ
jgi:uncharacterized protein (DUF924 family)